MSEDGKNYKAHVSLSENKKLKIRKKWVKLRILNEKIEKRLKEAIHSVEIECGKMSEEEIELQRKLAYKEISREEFLNELDIIARSKWYYVRSLCISRNNSIKK